MSRRPTAPSPIGDSPRIARPRPAAAPDGPGAHRGAGPVVAARRRLPALLLACAALALPASAEQPRRPDGRIAFEELRAGYVGSAGGGGGTLHFQGRSHRFSIVSVGVGGVGAASSRAQGEVFNLRHLRDFPGEYVQLRSGATIGSGSGEVWLRNAAGVELHLRVERTGLMLNFGADAVVIRMD
jgi:hypothetical protein